MSNQIPEPTQDVQDEKRTTVDGNQTSSAEDTTKWRFNPEYHEFADFLGLKADEKSDESLAQKLSFLHDYTHATDILDAKIKIMELQKQLGVNYQGKTLVNHLYQYVRLLQQRDSIDKEIDLTVEQAQYVEPT
jgi:hypothetical protein